MMRSIFHREIHVIDVNVYGVRGKQQLNRISEWPQQSQWKQSFFISSVGMNKNTDSHKNKTHDSNNDTLCDGKIWEKIADQTGYKNSFSDIIKSFGNKFNFTVTHQAKAYHTGKKLSRFIVEYAAGTNHITAQVSAGSGTTIDGAASVSILRQLWRSKALFGRQQLVYVLGGED